MEYTSGKECYPCQITMGDILHFMQQEAGTPGIGFEADDYVYFMPEADGPCRFGMYNKYQRIVLDSFPELKRMRIGSLTTGDGYSLAGFIDRRRVRDLRKVAYFSVVVADILDRLLWRIRPYEKAPGTAEEFIGRALRRLEETFETHGPKKNFDAILRILEEILREGRGIVDPEIPRKPLIGMVGEIYLRTHEQANQGLIRVLETYGAEVVNASIAEWLNYTSYERLREARVGVHFSLRRGDFKGLRQSLKKVLSYAGDLWYQEFRQKQVYRRAGKLIDLPQDHRIGGLERVLQEEDLFSFDVGTEACLSIAGIVEYARDGYDGVVNVYPFTCMPSTTTSAIVRPIMSRLGVPYLDTSYDSSIQPGREAAIRTFMYQARQHFERNGRRRAFQFS